MDPREVTSFSEEKLDRGELVEGAAVDAASTKATVCEEKVDRDEIVEGTTAIAEVPATKTYVISKQDFVLDVRYKPIKRLGSGAFGVVCSARDEKSGERVAIKKIHGVFMHLDDSRRVLREIRLLQHLKHPNIVSLLDLMQPAPVEDFDDVYLVLEYMQSDLRSILYSSDNDLTEDHVAYIVYQILCGLKYMHSANVIHRDIKPDNILINSDCKVKICDLGLARDIPPTRSSTPAPSTSSASQEDAARSYIMSEYVVTRWYRAPEVMLSGGFYGFPIDVWSVGCVLAELLGKQVMFPGENYVDQLNLIFRTIGTPSEEDLEFVRNVDAMSFVSRMKSRKPKDLSTLFPSASEAALDLLSKFLVFNPAKRITVDEALKHPFFSKFYNEDFVTKESSCASVFDSEYEKLTRTRKDIQDLMMEDVKKFRPYLSKQALSRATSAVRKSAKVQRLRRTISGD